VFAFYLCSHRLLTTSSLTITFTSSLVFKLWHFTTAAVIHIYTRAAAAAIHVYPRATAAEAIHVYLRAAAAIYAYHRAAAAGKMECHVSSMSCWIGHAFEEDV
jgi:hypothetical protein